MFSTASPIEFETSDDVTSSAWYMEWTRRATSKCMPPIIVLFFILVYPTKLNHTLLFSSFLSQIEIDLEPEYRYHSIFACPILRQQSSEDNPPMKLVCGHVISRDALNKLCNGPT